MKQFAKSIVVLILRWQLRRLRNKSDFKIIAVAGSVGKTSTKLTIASILGNYLNVQVQEGNYNDIVTVPLIFFGRQNPPRITNPFAWLGIFIHNEKLLKKDNYKYDVVIVELGTDGPGQIKKFQNMFKADIGVLTAIGQEHMMNFESVDEVASEELELINICNKVVANSDDINEKYLKLIKNPVTYGTNPDSDIIISSDSKTINIKHDKESITFNKNIIGIHLQKAFGAAYAVCKEFGLTKRDDIESSFAAVKAIPGRMQLLKGINGSELVDDTYNNVSPVPVKAALDVLYEWPKVKKIAVLGNMNELGKFSEAAHKEVGEYCDRKKLTELLTIGPHANSILASTAAARKNKVHRFSTPYEIADYLKDKLDKDTVVLFKGSQNKVYLEESIKQLLANKDDERLLVRQSKHWLKTKRRNFKEFK